MTIATMRAIDRFIGVPLCHLAGWTDQLRKLFPHRVQPPSSRVILVTKFFGLGSILLAKPLLEALKKNIPDCVIVFLTFEGNRELAQRFSEVNVIQTIRTTTLSRFLVIVAG